MKTIFVILITIARKIFSIPLIINPSWKVSSNFGIKVDEIRYLNLSLKKIAISIVIHLVKKCFILSICLCVCLSACLSICLSVCPLVSEFVCLSVCPSFSLSVSLPVTFIFHFLYLSVCSINGDKDLLNKHPNLVIL